MPGPTTPKGKLGKTGCAEMAKGYGIAGDIGSRRDKGFDGLPSHPGDRGKPGPHIWPIGVPGFAGVCLLVTQEERVPLEEKACRGQPDS